MFINVFFQHGSFNFIKIVFKRYNSEIKKLHADVDINYLLLKKNKCQHQEV